MLGELAHIAYHELPYDHREVSTTARNTHPSVPKSGILKGVFNG